MHKKFAFILALLVIVILSLLFYINLPHGQQKTYKVLYVASYHPSLSWTSDIRDGFIQAFKDDHIKIELKSFYMNTKIYSEPQEIRAKGEEARKLIFKWNPDIIITSDENALTQVALPLRNTKYKFVFSGVNGTPEMYKLPAKNITGVLERWHYVDAVRILKLLDPNVKRISILSEKSESSALSIQQFKTDEHKIPVQVTGIYQTNSFEEWKRLIKESQTRSDALMIVLYFSLKDSSGRPIPEKEIINWLINNSKIPEVGLWPFLAKDGGLLAVSVSGFSQGYVAGNIAIQVLQGKNPKSIKIKPTRDGAIYINEKRAKQLRIIVPPDLMDGAKIIWDTKCNE